MGERLLAVSESSEGVELINRGFRSLLQEAPGHSLEGFDVLDVDEAAPDLECSLVLQPPESPGHRLPVCPDHGAQVLVGVASWYPDLPWDLHALALYEKEDETREP